MTTRFDALLDEIREIARSKKDVGDRFEEIVQVYVNHDSQMQQSYSEAMPWKDWVIKHKQKWSIKDDGIDIVARNRDDRKGNFAAIQAKCRQKNYKLQKRDIDSFYTTADSKGFKTLIFVDTTEVDPSPNFQEVVDRKQITHIRLKDLAESTVDWESFIDRGETRCREPKEPRPHQVEAVENVREGLKSADRGQIIMACGTGKTFTGLLVAQRVFGLGKRILVLVPSLALMAQMIREWHADATLPLRSYSVCSDTEIGRHDRISEDVIQLTPSDLKIPPTTHAAELYDQAKNHVDDAITVVFGTYHSVAVIHQAQHEFKLPDFDLILCDEAHRTTGQFDQDKEDEAPVFVRIHDDQYVRSRKRLYMTATPRIYTTASKTKAIEDAINLCSMDNIDLYGDVLFYRSFAWAVEHNLLSDYRVIVLALNERLVNEAVQRILASDDSDIKLDDATKIVGCYHAMLKKTGPDNPNEFITDPKPTRRVLAFCNSIKNSKIVSNEFAKIVDTYSSGNSDSKSQTPRFKCSVKHVDGKSGSHERDRCLDWLSSGPEKNEVRILSNVRCLGEGVDVPTLDAIAFFHPRKSQIDVVQAVGRVMRKAPGKKYGYVILPVAIPSGVSPEDSLKNNKTYETVWQILNALRSHDERLEADINRLLLEGDDLDRVRVLLQLPEVVERNLHFGYGESTDDNGNGKTPPFVDPQLQFDPAMVQGYASAMYAKIVTKVGSKQYWSKWAAGVGEIAQTQITRINTVLKTDEESKLAFDEFVAELQDDLNPSVTSEQALELLAQHIITRPIFNALFEGHEFIKQNSVSIAMESVLEKLDTQNLDREMQSLNSFYNDVRWRIKDTETPQAKQHLVKELYDNFFRTAFPRATEMLGIVFTPVEIVDYVIYSIEFLLREHFETSMSDEHVHVIDPFVGTGTFITRLLQSGIIRPEDLRRKYQSEIHANEIVLLAYYVAGINIEAVYHDVRNEENGTYEPYERIVFQDTFQSSEQENQLDGIFPFNHKRIEYQKKLPLTVVLGNPPYSKGQKSQSDNAQNVRYPTLDGRIGETYVEASNATLTNSLYDSYVRAFRWASDRLGDRGIVGFVTGAGWLEGNAASGIRACFAREFSHIYVINLRGNARLKGELWRKEGDKIFGQASRSAITLTFLVKDSSSPDPANIHYYDIGDYLKREEKLEKLKEFRSVANCSMTQIEPNKEYDWIGQRNPQFATFLPLARSKDGKETGIFHENSLGIATSRDAWIYNFNKKKLLQNVSLMATFYNQEIDRYLDSGKDELPKDFVKVDRKKIAWGRDLFQRFKTLEPSSIDTEKFFLFEYRPMTKMWCYFDAQWINEVYRLPKIFPTPQTNISTICVNSAQGSPDLSSWMVALPPNGEIVRAAKCFPLHHFINVTPSSLVGADSAQVEEQVTLNLLLPRDTLEYMIGWDELDADDMFYYIYGILLCPEYIDRFRNNLVKELPRIPLVDSRERFLEFVQAGKQLAELHIHYDQAMEYEVTETWIDNVSLENTNLEAKFRVQQMKFLDKNDRESIQYNPYLKISNIPHEAYEFQVNGKSLVEWVMDRQRVSTHKDSGIVNDANDFAIKTMKDPAYPLKLLKKAITVGIKTHEIQQSLPSLRIHEKMGG